MQKLVLIDDDEAYIAEFRKAMQALAETEGLKSASEALHHLESLRHADLILLDVHLMDSSGFALLEKLRGLESCLPPVVFISEDHSEETKNIGFQLKVCDYLTKSMSIDELRNRLTNAIRLSAPKTSLRRGNLVLHLDKFECEFDASLKTETSAAVERQVLTKIEYQIICSLMKSPYSLKKAELEQIIWPGTIAAVNALNTHVSNLNKKLGAWTYFVRFERDGLVRLSHRETAST